MPIGRTELNWKGNSLYHGTKDTGYCVVGNKWSSNVSDLWDVRWPDGALSEYPCNLTCAKDNCMKVYLTSIKSTD